MSCVLGNHAAQGTIGYTCDWVGNLTNIDYPASVDVRLQYDALGRLTNLVDAVGTSVFGYWPGGALRFEDGPWASDTLTNTYTRGRRTALLLQQPAGSWTNAFGHDTAGRLTNVTSPAGVFGYLYPASGVRHQVSRLLLPSGAYITNDFDSVGRLLFTKLLTSGGVVTNSHSYDYNVASQRTKTTRPDTSTVSYGYDPIGQLTLARATNGGGTQISGEHRGYAYDAAWNLNWRTNGSTLEEFLVNVKNELTNSSVGGLASYDANGNLLDDSRLLCEYDDANQLVAIERFEGPDEGGLGRRTELVYDGLGRLRVRREWQYEGELAGFARPPEPALQYAAALMQSLDGGGGGWYFDYEVDYLYDGRRVIQERLYGGGPTVSYTRGRDLSGTLEGAGGIGGLLARSHGYGSGGGTWSTHNYYHADGNGNVTFLLAADQSLAARYVYDPYGNTVSQTGSLADANVYRFSSKEHHPGSGLYYYLYRWYDPGTQRWMNRDPIQERGGVNLFAFLSNLAAGFADAFGLKDYDEIETWEKVYVARTEAKEGWLWGMFNILRNHSNLLEALPKGLQPPNVGKFDFKVNGPSDTFCVNGKRMEADAFGNYLAGYSARVWAGRFGILLVKLGGILYDALDFGRPSYNPLDLDADSRPDIDAGSAAAGEWQLQR